MAVTTTYLYPQTAAPTGAQMNVNRKNTLVATVLAGAAADTSAIITHAFNLTAAEITQGFPTVVLTAQDGNQITSPWYLASQNPNYTILQKGTVAAGGQVIATISRPHTIVR